MTGRRSSRHCAGRFVLVPTAWWVDTESNVCLDTRRVDSSESSAAGVVGAPLARGSAGGATPGGGAVSALVRGRAFRTELAPRDSPAHTRGCSGSPQRRDAGRWRSWGSITGGRMPPTRDHHQGGRFRLYSRNGSGRPDHLRSLNDYVLTAVALGRRARTRSYSGAAWTAPSLPRVRGMDRRLVRPRAASAYSGTRDVESALGRGCCGLL